MLLKMENIGKIYESKYQRCIALEEISLEVGVNEFIIIMGPSGCGKTTLLNILGLITSPTSGKYTIRDELVNNMSFKKKANLRNNLFGYLLQDFALIENDTVINNILLPMKYSDKKFLLKTKEERAKGLASSAGINTKLNEKVKNLSVGQRQRVAFCRALINMPKIILADEPTGSLDSQNSEELIKNLLEFHKRGNSVIMVTHNLEYANIGSRLITMKDGHIEY